MRRLHYPSSSAPETSIPNTDAAARAVIPSMPPLSPHLPLSRHLRHILPLLSMSNTLATHNTHTSNFNLNVDGEKDEEPIDVDDATEAFSPEDYLHQYTAAVEQAKYSEVELTEEEFDRALKAASALKGM